MLLCDFGNLEREVKELARAGVPGFHLDVMDGHFVPNLTYGMPLVETVRRLTDLPLDVHLMISNPEDRVGDFANAGADIITIHAEAIEDPRPVLDQVRDAGLRTGLAINPDTPVTVLERALELCDVVLVMSVPPGYGGQTFRPDVLDKIRDLKRRTNVVVEVDGGINASTIGSCAQAGADIFVAGSAIFRSPCYKDAVESLSRLATTARGVV